MKKPVKDKERKREARSLAAVGSHGCAAYLHLLSPLSPHHAVLLPAHRSFSASCSSFVSFSFSRSDESTSASTPFFLLCNPSFSVRFPRKIISLTSFRTIETTSSHFFYPLSPGFFLYFSVPMEQPRLTFLSFGHLSFFRTRSVSPRSVRKHSNLVASYVYAHILIIAENGRGERERRNR